MSNDLKEYFTHTYIYIHNMQLSNKNKKRLIISSFFIELWIKFQWGIT